MVLKLETPRNQSECCGVIVEQFALFSGSKSYQQTGVG